MPVPVIELSFRAVLVFPVGKPHLVASHPAAAPLSAVDLPPVAASTDVKPHPAIRPSAKQLDPCHFAGHTPQDFIARQALGRAGARATTAAALLENPRIGVIHLDRRGQILEINDRARSLLRRGKGLSDRDGVLRTRQPADQRRLERLVAGALPTAGAVPVSGSMLLARAAGAPPFVVHVKPVAVPQPDYGARYVAALVLLIEPRSQHRIDPDLMTRTLGLTPMESRIAVGLAEGKSVRELAAATGRTPGAISWHLKQIYRRQPISGQVDLVRLVLSLTEFE